MDSVEALAREMAKKAGCDPAAQLAIAVVAQGQTDD